MMSWELFSSIFRESFGCPVGNIESFSDSAFFADLCGSILVAVSWIGADLQIVFYGKEEEKNIKDLLCVLEKRFSFRKEIRKGSIWINCSCKVFENCANNFSIESACF